MNEKRVTVPMVRGMKKKGEKIVMLTAYDFTFAALMDQAEIDILLVGDSLGMVVQGHDSTLPVTVEDIIYHTRAVKRAAKRAMVVADMPFLSYQITPEEAVLNAGRLLKEGGADAVKLEGGERYADTVRALIACGIPVMGHVGLLPQSVRALGGYRAQGRTEESAERIRRDARALDEAGCFAIVLECIPAGLAAEITHAVAAPTIGIGAGPDCDGQVLVVNDLLGLSERAPAFVRPYAGLRETIRAAFAQFRKDVESGAFPGAPS